MGAPGSTRRVAAVMPTHNRPGLLREALRALQAQTWPLAEIVVVDSASTAETQRLLADEFPDVEVVRLEVNGGGANAYKTGLEHAFARGHDFYWLLDDDAIARPEAVERLMAAVDVTLPGRGAPRVLASRVVTSDGELHPMNVPRPDWRSVTPVYEAAAHGLSPIRACSFVACLVSHDAVAEHGLPHAEYFLWNDDSEYTARILRDGLGWFVPGSVVEHRTAATGLPVDRGGPIMYYEFRNKLWMIRTSSWALGEKARLGMEVASDLCRYVARNRRDRECLAAAARGVSHGLFGDRPA